MKINPFRRHQKLSKLFIHEHLVRDHNATGAFILANIYFLCVKHGQCLQSIKSIAIRTGISRNTVTRHVKLFEQQGLIARIASTHCQATSFLIGLNADRTVITAYSQWLIEGKKSKDSGKLIELDLSSIVMCAGKGAEKERFIAFFRAFCIDNFASKLARENESYAYFNIGSITRLARRFGIARQTLSRIIKTLHEKSEIVLARFEENTIIDVMLSLVDRVKRKQRQMITKDRYV